MKIEMQHVSKTLNGKKVLNDINAVFESGKIYGLKGYNGSGKTMMLRTACGLLYPTEGSVVIDGKRLGKDFDFPDSVGLLIESPAFIDNLNAWKNLKLIISLRSGIDAENLIQKALQRVGLDQTGKLKYSRFSMGMKQRLGIAAAIMEDPALLILDEPTNALDEEGIQMVKEVILNMKSKDRIIIIASHEREFLDSIADEVVTISEGRFCRNETKK